PHAWHSSFLRRARGGPPVHGDPLIRELAARDIGVSVHFIPLHLHPYYRDKYGYGPDDFPRAHAAFQRIVSLPLFPKMTDGDVARAAGAVREVLEAKRP